MIFMGINTVLFCGEKKGGWSWGLLEPKNLEEVSPKGRSNLWRWNITYLGLASRELGVSSEQKLLHLRRAAQLVSEGYEVPGKWRKHWTPDQLLGAKWSIDVKMMLIGAINKQSKSILLRLPYQSPSSEPY